MYDPVTARFLQEDMYTGEPEEPLSLNLYTYCGYNPIKYIDPSGHMVVYEGGGIKQKKKNINRSTPQIASKPQPVSKPTGNTQKQTDNMDSQKNSHGIKETKKCS